MFASFVAGLIAGLIVATAIRWAQARREEARHQHEDDDYALFLASLSAGDGQAQRVALAAIPTVCLHP